MRTTMAMALMGRRIRITRISLDISIRSAKMERIAAAIEVAFRHAFQGENCESVTMGLNEIAVSIDRLAVAVEVANHNAVRYMRQRYGIENLEECI
jgi:hypothetical protein